MQTKRLFVGAFIPHTIFSRKLAEINREFSAVSFGKWVENENLHFTMKFIGDIEASQVKSIKERLSDTLGEYKSNLYIRGLGTLPKRGQARVLYMGVDTDDCLLNETSILIESALEEEGFQAESRDFFPHITLQRIKSSTNDFNSIIKKYSNLEFGKLESYHINLIESRLTPNGPIYRII